MYIGTKEGKLYAFSCVPEWVLNDTWSTCDISDHQYKYYFDVNNCNIDTGQFPLNQSCDYCTPSWQCSNYSACAENDKKQCNNVIDLNNCSAQTNLSSDMYSGNFSEFESEYCDYNDNGVIGNLSCINTNIPYLNISIGNLSSLKRNLKGTEVTPILVYSNASNVFAILLINGQRTTALSNNQSFLIENEVRIFIKNIIERRSGDVIQNLVDFCLYIGDERNCSGEDINDILEVGQTKRYAINGNNEKIKFTVFNETIIEFDYNFTLSTLNLFNLTIETQNSSSDKSYIRITGLDLTSQDQTKTVYMDRILNGTGLCIKDLEIASISEISGTCTSSDETWLACPATTALYNCSLINNNTQYKITGLRHSGVQEQSTYCGDSVCNGGESCSSCSTDCGSCSTTGGSSGGGGGGGGLGGGGIAVTYTCPDWSPCGPDNKQTRVCTPNIGTKTKTETRSCVYAPPATPTTKGETANTTSTAAGTPLTNATTTTPGLGGITGAAVTNVEGVKPNTWVAIEIIILIVTIGLFVYLKIRTPPKKER